MTTLRRLLALTTSIALSSGLAAAADFDWPQFRGPNRDDVSRETGLLKQWPAGGPKRLWLFEKAGNGYSGFAVVADRLYTVGIRDNQETLITLDAKTGKEL